jgi:hypothetical protein
LLLGIVLEIACGCLWQIGNQHGYTNQCTEDMGSSKVQCLS